MKKRAKKLILSKESLRSLEKPGRVAGGGVTWEEEGCQEAMTTHDRTACTWCYICDVSIIEA